MMPPCFATSAKMLQRWPYGTRIGRKVVKILKLATPDWIASPISPIVWGAPPPAVADRLRRDLARKDVVEREVGVGVAAEDGAPPLDVLGDGYARGVGRGRQVEIAPEVEDRRPTPP